MFRQEWSRAQAARQAWWRPAPATAVFGGILAAGILLANLLGRPAIESDIAAQPPRGRRLIALRSTVAGWPVSCLAVQGESLLPLLQVEDSLVWFSLVAGVANLAAGISLSAVGGMFLSLWWHSRRRWCQFGLCDLALATALVGVLLAVGVLPCVRRLREEGELSKLALVDQSDSIGLRDQDKNVVWQPVWHARLQSRLPFALPPAGHVVGLNAYGCESHRIIKFRGLKALRVSGTVTDRQLSQLAALPQLECLDLCDARLRLDWEDTIEFPPQLGECPLRLPHLKRLYAHRNVFQGSDLVWLPAIEELDLAGTLCDQRSAQTIARLTTLRILDLHDSDLTDEQLAEFSALPRLTMLDLSGTNVTDAGLVHLRRLPRLEIVWLARTAVSDEGLDSLQACPNLQSVRLTGSRVSGRRLASFRRACPTCVVLP